MKNRLTLIAGVIAGAMFALSLIGFFINTRIAEGKPLIQEIEPLVVSAGDSLSVRGKNFGDKKDSSKVFLSNVDLLSKYIRSWTRDEIVIEVPSNAESGLISIKTDRGRSEPFVVVMQENVPYIGAGAYIPGLPFIETIDPNQGGAGSIMTIRGDNFGDRMNNSTILFPSRFSSEYENLSGDTILLEYLQVSRENVLSWSNKEIKFFAPEQVVTGNVYVKNETGHSNAVYFEQHYVNSSVKLGERRTYMMNHRISLPEGTLNEEEHLNLWIPNPVEDLFQRNLVSLKDRGSENFYMGEGLELYKIRNNTAGEEVSISHNSIIDIYSREIIIDPDELVDTYERNSAVFRKYTQAEENIPVATPRVSGVARSVVRRSGTNYDKARAIYNYLLARLSYSEEIEEWSPELVIDSMIADSKAYSLLFVSLARSSSIPARPVVGVLVDDQGISQSHWWCEFFIQGFGWFPLDPSLADGKPRNKELENPVEYYWGNIDNQHIVFSRGTREIPRLIPEGVTINKIDYADVTHIAETDSEIIDLQLMETDVKMTAIY